MKGLANKLTVLRLILILPFIFHLELAYLFNRAFIIFAMLIYIIAVITDYFDGKIARATDTVSDFGKMMDPIADKLLTFSYLIILVSYSRISALFVLIMLAREILVTQERIYLVSINQGVLPASILGKIKTIVLMITILLLMILDSGIVFNNILLLPSVILTVISGYEYHKYAKNFF